MARKPQRRNRPAKSQPAKNTPGQRNGPEEGPLKSDSRGNLADRKTPSADEKPAAKAEKKEEDKRTKEQKLADTIRTSGGRETVEAFVVAFILALLFRAFIAEAFVIPTGSMAPALMGAHKDIFCSQCDHRFQIGASKERRGGFQHDTVVAGICPNCRFVNNLDLKGEAHDGTFNGDRILVSKYAYALNAPERWDVIVFKFPGNPKQNYIKRLVGLPEETLTIRHGDIHVEKESGIQQILRKPDQKLMAMRHHVYDTDQLSSLLVNADYPSRFQPWHTGAQSPPEDSWNVSRENGDFRATLDSGSDQSDQWLRYFHRWPTASQWKAAQDGQSLADVDPYSSQLITDYYAYDCYITVGTDSVYEKKIRNSGSNRDQPRRSRLGRVFEKVQGLFSSPEFNEDYQSGGPLSQFGFAHRFGERNIADRGLHWVGDLIVETDLETSAESKAITLEIVESGVQYQCAIDLENGEARLSVVDGEQRIKAFEDGDNLVDTVKGKTSVQAGKQASIRFSNCDDELRLWVDDQRVKFDRPTTYRSSTIHAVKDKRPYFDGSRHPLDASPFGLAVRGGKAAVNRINIHRDKYYIAADNQNGITDYLLSELNDPIRGFVNDRDIQDIMGSPEDWSRTPVWSARRSVTFQLEADQFFPMGDNSPESLDARCWAGSKRTQDLPLRFREQADTYSQASYVPRDLLVGKAILVFWPHPWKKPVPFTPNFGRFRLIR